MIGTNIQIWTSTKTIYGVYSCLYHYHTQTCNYCHVRTRCIPLKTFLNAKEINLDARISWGRANDTESFKWRHTLWCMYFICDVIAPAYPSWPSTNHNHRYRVYQSCTDGKKNSLYTLPQMSYVLDIVLFLIQESPKNSTPYDVPTWFKHLIVISCFIVSMSFMLHFICTVSQCTLDEGYGVVAKWNINVKWVPFGDHLNSD